jgi:hypothetical protein
MRVRAGLTQSIDQLVGLGDGPMSPEYHVFTHFSFDVLSSNFFIAIMLSHFSLLQCSIVFYCYSANLFSTVSAQPFRVCYSAQLFFHWYIVQASLICYSVEPFLICYSAIVLSHF